MNLEGGEVDPLPGSVGVFPPREFDATDPELEALTAAVVDAYDRARVERWERFVDDLDIGELHEHLGVSQTQVENGVWNVQQLFAIGDEIFEREFRAIEGYGRGQGLPHGQAPARTVTTTIRRVHEGALGGPDTGSCNDCHHRGGPDGAGDLTQNALVAGDGTTIASANERNPPPVIGLGAIELLCKEMSAELKAAHQRAFRAAQVNKAPVEQSLFAKGVFFGKVTIHPDGSFDPKQLRGVDADLVVKPFGWKGQHATLRSFSKEALQGHMGMISQELVDEHKQSPKPEIVGDGPDYDPDKDGTYQDISYGQLTALQIYIALLEVPVIRPPRSPEGVQRYLDGSREFQEMGCAGCHVPAMVLKDDTYSVPKVREEGKELTFRLSEHMEEPGIRRDEPHSRGYVVRAFSDFRRHDMGPALAENKPSGDIPASHFRTPPLWGLAESAPYLHDGRAATIDEAILAHGGDAADSAAAFRDATDAEKINLRVYLLSLTRMPKLVYR